MSPSSRPALSVPRSAAYGRVDRGQPHIWGGVSKSGARPTGSFHAAGYDRDLHAPLSPGLRGTDRALGSCLQAEPVSNADDFLTSAAWAGEKQLMIGHDRSRCEFRTADRAPTMPQHRSRTRVRNGELGIGGTSEDARQLCQNKLRKVVD